MRTRERRAPVTSRKKPKLSMPFIFGVLIILVAVFVYFQTSKESASPSPSGSRMSASVFDQTVWPHFVKSVMTQRNVRTTAQNYYLARNSAEEELAKNYEKVSEFCKDALSFQGNMLIWLTEVSEKKSTEYSKQLTDACVKFITESIAIIIYFQESLPNYGEDHYAHIKYLCECIEDEIDTVKNARIAFLTESGLTNQEIETISSTMEEELKKP